MMKRSKGVKISAMYSQFTGWTNPILGYMMNARIARHVEHGTDNLDPLVNAPVRYTSNRLIASENVMDILVGSKNVVKMHLFSNCCLKDEVDSLEFSHDIGISNDGATT